MGWRLDGKVLWQGSWKNGQRDQLFTVWYSNGVKKLEMEYNEGILKRKSKFDMRGQVTENIVVPPGRTIHWTEKSLESIKATKQQIQQSFGPPEKVNGENWIYSGIHVVVGGAIKKVSISISFDATGLSSGIAIQE